jgi:hypothetical protein
MHNDTPLGTTMHLKELDRQAMMDRHRPRARTQDAFRVIAIWAATIALLRRLTVGAAPGRVASRG